VINTSGNSSTPTASPYVDPYGNSLCGSDPSCDYQIRAEIGNSEWQTPWSSWVTVGASGPLSPQTIHFTSTAPANAAYGGTYTVAATGGASGEPVTFSAAALSVCTVSGSTVTFTGVGTCTIDANQAGNSSFSAAPQVAQGVAVGKAPTKLTTTPPTVLSSVLALKVTFSATLTSSTTGKGVSGQTVTFSDGSSVSCSGVTNASGVASCSVSVLDVLDILLTPSYKVSYAGGSDDVASSTAGTSSLL
jgi:hypothetical protein